MKKAMLTMAILMLVLIFSSINNSGLVGEIYAWDDCPKGMVNDEYPGSCSRYIDTDENGICDHSEPAPEDRINNQDQNKEISEKQTKNSIAPTDGSKIENALNVNAISFLSIFMPLIVLLGYATVYKIKQNKIS